MTRFFYLISVFISFLTINARDPLVDIIGRTPQKEVADATEAPYKSVGQILSLSTSVPSEFTPAKLWPGRCSGTVISPIHILTAAHCITDYKFNYDAPIVTLNDEFSIRFYPGLNADVYNGIDEGKAAFSTGGWIFTNTDYVAVTAVRKSQYYKKWKYTDIDSTVTDWRKNYEVKASLQDQHDYGILVVDSSTPLDDSLILELKYDDSLDVGNILHTAGYPGDKNPKYHMYENNWNIETFLTPQQYAPGQSDIATTTLAKQNAPLITDESYEAAGGQSGSMIYRMTKGLAKSAPIKTEIVGVLVSEMLDTVKGVRLTTDSINEICRLMKIGDTDNNWKKQKGCPGWDTAHTDDINILKEEYYDLLFDINSEKIKRQKALRLLNKEKRRKNHHYFKTYH